MRVSRSQTVGSTRSSCDRRTYYALKVRFSVTLGEEPEVEVALV